jgi:magnesium-transporting ATPase (P-type)
MKESITAILLDLKRSRRGPTVKGWHWHIKWQHMSQIFLYMCSLTTHLFLTESASTFRWEHDSSACPCDCVWLQVEAQCNGKTGLYDVMLLLRIWWPSFLEGNLLILYGLKGIWVGVLIGTVLQTMILFVILSRTKWQKEVQYTMSIV